MGKHLEYRSTIVFMLKDKVGALYDVLKSFKKNKINLTKIVSRPYKKEWEYIFFVEVNGRETDAGLGKAIKEIKRHVISIYVLGSYVLRRI